MRLRTPCYKSISSAPRIERDAGLACSLPKAGVECTNVIAPGEDESEASDDYQIERLIGFRIDKPETLTWVAVGALLDRCFFVVHLICSATVLTIYVMKGYVPWSGYSSIRANLSGTDMLVMCEQLKMQKAKFDDLACESAMNYF